MKLRAICFIWGLLAMACGSTPTTPPADADVAKVLPADAIPMAYYDGHFYFKSTLCDSLEAQLVFDTGADGLYLDSLWLAHSGYQPRRCVQGVMGGGSGSDFVRTQVILDTLTARTGLDTLHFGMSPVLDLKGILGRAVDGVIGHSNLASRCVQISYCDGYMRLISPDTLIAAGYTKLPFRKNGNRIFVPVRVRIDSLRTVDGELLLDVGSGAGVLFGASVFERLDMNRYAGRSYHYRSVSDGVGGEAQSLSLCADSIILAGFAMPGVNVEISRNTGGLLARESFVGLLGNKVLERFDLAIDYPGAAIYLKPNETYSQPFETFSCGFSAIDRTDISEGWLVTGLYQGVAPEGLSECDTVVSWDARPVRELEIGRTMKTPGRHRIGVLCDGKIQVLDCETKKLF